MHPLLFNVDYLEREKRGKGGPYFFNGVDKSSIRAKQATFIGGGFLLLSRIFKYCKILFLILWILLYSLVYSSFLSF